VVTLVLLVAARFRRERALTVLALLSLSSLLGATACGGGGQSAGDGVSGGDASLATLNVLSANVSTAKGDQGSFATAQSGESLAQGDRVQTDASGLAEVAYFDGSWQRVENQTTLTLTELVDIEDGQVVRTGLDQGRAWQRVQKLTGDGDSFEVDTPVAVGSVRGTEFAIDCSPAPVACTFSVVEGVVALALSSGSSVTLNAGDRLSVQQDTPPGEPEHVGVDQLRQDPWIAKNLALDAAGPPAPPGGASGGTGTLPTASGPFADQANAICAAAGEQSDAIVNGGASNDEIARQQAVVLDRALDDLAALDPPPEIADRYQAMIDSYRRRTSLVNQALAASAEERVALVTQLLGQTAAGADLARSLGLNDCVIRSS
jgi:hypothetical protein